jgi:tetratricopeptide (TPR) repeat protein
MKIGSPEVSKLVKQFTNLSLLVFSLCIAGCSRPASLKSTLKERINREPESINSFGDADANSGYARFREELSRTSTPQNVPDSESEFNFLKGELLVSQDKYEEALVAYGKAETSLTAPSPLLAKRIIQLYIKEGDLVKAIAVAKDYHLKLPADQQITEILAGAYSATGNNLEAIGLYKELIESATDKKREELLMILASIYTVNKDIPAAKDTLRKALIENPKNALAIYYLGRLQELEGDIIGAEKRYKQAVKEAPENDGLHLELARFLAQTKRFQEAKDHAQLVVARSPQNPLARQLLGQLMLATNNVDGALSELQKLQSLEQNPRDTRLRIALINLEQKDFASAEKELNLVVASKPSDGTARYYLLLAYAGQNKVEEALANVSKITPKDKFFIESRLITAFVLKQASRLSEAATILIDADTKLGDSSDPRVLAFLVSLLKDLNRSAEAINFQKKLIILEPTRDSNYFLLAVLLDDTKNFEESISAGKKAIELNPKNADALNFVGYSLADNEQNLEEATRFVEAALAIEPKNGYFIDSLGWIYFKQNKFPEAVSELEKAVELVPSDAVILEHLAQAYIKTKDYDKARAIVVRALPNADSSDDKGVVIRLQELQKALQDLSKK